MNRSANATCLRLAGIAALSAAMIPPVAAASADRDAADLLARAIVPDAELDSMRGGFDLGTMIGRFAIERIVRIDGEIVARTQLMLDRLDGLSRGQMPDARLVGNLATLVQVGDGNRATNGPQSAAQASLPAALGAAPPSTPVATQQPVSAGDVSTANLANGLSADWGTALAQAVAIANGDESNRPVPVNVGAVPSGGAAAAAAGTGSVPSSSSSTPTAGAPPSAPAVPTIAITIPIGTGSSIVVAGIPDGPALATSIQNSVQATRIQTETRINAALSSLSALRSLNFAAQLRQQAIDAAR